MRWVCGAGKGAGRPEGRDGDHRRGRKDDAAARAGAGAGAAARVIVTTTTHIYPPDGFPCLLQPGEAEIAAALEKHPCVCVGKPAKEGKITAADVPVRTLAELADYVLVEADGAHGGLQSPCGL